VRYAICLLLVAYAVFGPPNLSFGPTKTVAVKISEPSDAMKVEVKPLVAIVSKMSPIDRLWLKHIYSNAAKVVEADGAVEPAVVTTTEGLRAIHVAILKFIWRGMAENSPKEYEGLDRAINEIFTDVIGDSQRGLTPDLRRKAVEMFGAISWAGLGKDE